MVSTNPFDLLGDDDNDDPAQLLAKLPVTIPTAKKSPAGGVPAKPAPKLPSKPLPPAQAVREAKNDGQRGGGRFGGHGGRGFNRDSGDNENFYGTNNGFSGVSRSLENGDSERNGPRGGNRGPRRGGYTNNGYTNKDAVEGERPRRVFERRSGTGRGNEFKREGAGRGNWGTPADEAAPETEVAVTETEKILDSDKKEDAAATKENTVEVVDEKEPEVTEMTLEEYEKVLEEKRKTLVSLKTEERKVVLDKDLAKMQILSNKKGEEDIFVKLGSEKDKQKEAADKEEKAKKSISIDEFLKAAEGEKYNNNPSGRGRGRGGRGFRGGFGGGNRINNVIAPSIEDVAQFPSLSVK